MGSHFYKILYLTYYLQGISKKVLLYGSTAATSRRLSSRATIVHTNFRIPPKGYLYALQEPNLTLQKLRETDVFIIDEMSMMTSRIINAIYYRVKQSTNGASNPSEAKLLLLVRDMAQLPPTCHHRIEQESDEVCHLCILQISSF